jgi:hypothetical protein
MKDKPYANCQQEKLTSEGSQFEWWDLRETGKNNPGLP